MPRKSSRSLIDAFAGLVVKLLGQTVQPAPVYVPVAVRQPTPVRIPVGFRR